MKKNILAFFIGTALLILCGCSTINTDIISEPTGARIEINNDYIGTTPCTVTLPQSFGTFSRSTTIRALPVIGGQYTQVKYFSGGIGGSLDDPIPKTVFFDMNLRPVQ